MSGRTRGVVFDKDGTLLDFAATWNPAIGMAIETIADGDEAAALRIADSMGYDLAGRTTLPGAALFAASNAEVVAMVPDGLGGERLPALLARFVLDTVTAATHADDLLRTLGRHGVPASIATNDDEASTIAQVARLRWTDRFVTVLGYDSGHGAKPHPGMVIEACRRMAVDVADTLMVGDSLADICAGRAAGATTVYVGAVPEHGTAADHWVDGLEGVGSLIA